VEIEMATLRVHLDYLRRKADLWDARDRGDTDAEAQAQARVHEIYPEIEMLIRA
jgi:hypothetical protein